MMIYTIINNSKYTIINLGDYIVGSFLVDFLSQSSSESMIHLQGRAAKSAQWSAWSGSVAIMAFQWPSEYGDLTARMVIYITVG